MVQGYIWTRSGKTLFLPAGTRIMRRYKQQAYYALVENSAFIADGNIYISPALLAHALSGGGAVNAWTVLWVPRPGETGWQQAATLAEGK